jgi:hypothetical protein
VAKSRTTARGALLAGVCGALWAGCGDTIRALPDNAAGAAGNGGAMAGNGGNAGSPTSGGAAGDTVVTDAGAGAASIGGNAGAGGNGCTPGVWDTTSWDQACWQ